MKASPLSRFRKAVYTASAFIFLALLASVPAVFKILDIRWAASISAVLLLIALLVLNYRSETAARLFQQLRLDLLIPSLKEVIDHHKKLQSCRQVMRKMEHTLEFYNLWELLYPSSGEPKLQTDEGVDKAPQGGGLRGWWARLRARLRWEKLRDELDKDPNPPQGRSLPPEVVLAIMDADDEEDQVRHCAQGVGKTCPTPIQIDSPSKGGKKPTVDKWMLEDLLDLLYRERFIMDTGRLWHRRWKEFTPVLAALLVMSGRLPPAEPDLPYDARDVERIMPREKFQLDGVRDALLEDLERRRQNRDVVEKMCITLAHYNLFPYLEKCKRAYKPSPESDYILEAEFRRLLIDEPCAKDDDRRIRTLARMIAEGMGCAPSPVTSNHLEMLYQEQHGLVERVRFAWEYRKHGADYCKGLAQILLGVPGFPNKEGMTPYSPAELASLIVRLEDYSLEQVKASIAVDQDIRARTRAEIQKMALTLNVYRLFLLLKWDRIQAGTVEGHMELAQWFQDELVKTMMDKNLPVGEDQWITAFANAVSQHMDVSRLAAEAQRPPEPLSEQETETPRPATLDAAGLDVLVKGWERNRGDLLGLLYRDQHGVDTGILWHDCKRKKSFSTGLVTILCLSQRLPQPDPDLPYGAGDLLELLAPLDGFSLDQVREAVLADQERRRENRMVVEGMMAVVHDYGLYLLLAPDDCGVDAESSHLTLSKTLRRKLIDKPRRQMDEQKRVRYYAAQIAARVDRSRMVEFVRRNIRGNQLSPADEAALAILDEVEPRIIADILFLLYGEIHRQEVGRLWRSKINTPGFALTLGVMLMLGGKLPIKEHKPPYGVLDLERILKSLPEYSFGAVAGELEKLSRVWQLVTNFTRFLNENDIPGKGAIFSEVLSMLSLPLDAAVQDETLKDVLIWAGQHMISQAFVKVPMPDLSRENGRYSPPVIAAPPDDQAATDLAYSLSLIAVILFITEELTGRLPLRQRICEQAGQVSRAAYIVLGYLEFKEYLRTEMKIDHKDFVSVDYLVKNWAGKVKEKYEKLGRGFNNEIETIREQLQDGKWPRRLPQMIETTINEISEKNRQVNQGVSSLVQRKPKLRKVLEAAFRNLTDHTIARYLEARTQTAYLLTFRVRGGSLAELLKIMVSEDRGIQARLNSLGIDLFVNKARKYNYQQYTDSARIGIIPEGWTFDRFEQAFQQDFEKVIAGRTRLLTHQQLMQNLHVLEDIEIIISRFDLSGQNYYGFTMKDLTQAKAIYQIRDLFSQILNPKDMATVIEYQEESLIAVLLNLPIVELVACQTTTKDAERAALRDMDLELKRRLADSLGFQTIRELAHALVWRRDRIMKAKSEMENLLSQIPEIDWNRRQIFADVYIDTLRVFADLT